MEQQIPHVQNQRWVDHSHRPLKILLVHHPWGRQKQRLSCLCPSWWGDHPHPVIGWSSFITAFCYPCTWKSPLFLPHSSGQLQLQLRFDCTIFLPMAASSLSIFFHDLFSLTINFPFSSYFQEKALVQPSCLLPYLLDFQHTGITKCLLSSVMLQGM